MENKIITENIVKEVLEKVLNEQTSKISRQEFIRIKFKLEEIDASISATHNKINELQKLIPFELKSITNGRTSTISTYLFSSQKLINQLIQKIERFKKSSYNQQPVEKKL